MKSIKDFVSFTLKLEEKEKHFLCVNLLLMWYINLYADWEFTRGIHLLQQSLGNSKKWHWLPFYFMMFSNPFIDPQ